MPALAHPYTVRDNAEKHRFEIDLGDGSLAIAQYTLPEGKIMFTHTEVPPQHEGKGIGSALIRFALASARSRGLKVIPICPFFAAYITKHAEEQDLLDPAFARYWGSGESLDLRLGNESDDVGNCHRQQAAGNIAEHGLNP